MFIITMPCYNDKTCILSQNTFAPKALRDMQKFR